VTRKLGIIASSHQGLPITNELASIPLNDRDLKNAMADPRYWDPGHPERAGFRDWITKGWETLYPAKGERPADGTVQVRPYTRVQYVS
jgi:hypothetical protein